MRPYGTPQLAWIGSELKRQRIELSAASSYGEYTAILDNNGNNKKTGRRYRRRPTCVVCGVQCNHQRDNVALQASPAIGGKRRVCRRCAKRGYKPHNKRIDMVDGKSTVLGTLYGSRRVHTFTEAPYFGIVESACGVVGRMGGDRQNVTPYTDDPNGIPKQYRCPVCFRRDWVKP